MVWTKVKGKLCALKWKVISISCFILLQVQQYVTKCHVILQMKRSHPSKLRTRQGEPHRVCTTAPLWTVITVQIWFIHCSHLVLLSCKGLNLLIISELTHKEQTKDINVKQSITGKKFYLRNKECVISFPPSNWYMLDFSHLFLSNCRHFSQQ